MPFRASLARLASWSVVAATAFVLLAPRPARAGWEVEYTATQGDVGVKSVILRLDENHVRVSPQGQDREVVVDPDGFTVIDHAKKTVMAVTYSQLEAALGGMASMLEAMQEAQKKAMEEAAGDMTPEERERFEAGMNQRENRLTLRPGEGTETVAGLAASPVVILEDGEEAGRLYLTQAIPSRALLHPLERLADIVPKAMLEQEKDMAVLLDLVDGIHGFPLKFVSVRPGEEATLVATRAEEVDLPGDTWAPPAGYTSEAFPLFNMGHAGDDGGW